MRTWRTARYLTPAQVFWRILCRGRLLYSSKAPRRAWRRIERAACALPPADPGNALLAPVAGHILKLQQAVHGPHVGNIASGRFTLLGRTVDFGSLGAVSWRRDLGEGNNALWRMTLSYFGYAPPLLASGDERALQIVLALVQSLERQNSFAASGVFRDVWNPYSASHRLINLLVGLHLFDRHARPRPAKAETHAARTALLAHIGICAAFVARNLERDLQYNHLLKDYVALVVYSCGVGELPVAWRFLHAALPACVESQVLSDGGHAERCPMYHVLSILDLMVLVDAGALDEAASSRIANCLARMRRAVVAMTHPDGDIALFNDSWLGEAPAARSLANGGCGQRLILANTGYVQLRSGGDAAIFDCGACGPDDNPAHAHADFLATELSVAGRRFLVDFGVPTYSSGPLRDAARSAASHNGPRFVGVEPLECWLSFRVGRRGRAYRIAALDCAVATPLWCAGWQDGYAPIGASVARCLVLYPGAGLLIVDVWRGGEDCEAAVDFLVSDAWLASEAPCFKATDDNAAVAVDAIVGVLAPPVPAQYWPRFGEAKPASRLCVSPQQDDAGRWSAVWIGWGGDVPEKNVAAGVRDALLTAVDRAELAA